MKMYLAIPVLAVITTLFSVSPAAGQSYKYTSPEGHYSMDFPGKPQESAQDDSTADGKPFRIHFATYSPKDDLVYMAGWIDFSFLDIKDDNIKTMLENSRDGALGSMNAKLIKNTALQATGKTPYIEFTFKTDAFTGKDRIYLIHKFQYSIITIFALKTGIPASADKFITSFKSNW